MPDPIEKSPLHRLANPRSLAVFGASNNVMAMGSNLLMSLESIGYPGRIYPVHPREDRIRGRPAFTSVLDLPETPDLALIVLPPQVVCQVLDECGQKGIRRAIVVSGGFKEVGGQGVALEKELQAVAVQYGIRVLGPNCLGVANPIGRLNTTFVPFEGTAGHIGMVSQSGSFVTQMFNYLDRFGLGFSTAFSVGNEMDLDLVDCLAYLGACPDTRVIALYVEGINRGRAFLDVARSIVPHKPIVAFYAGSSQAGRRAGFSHTGAMAGPTRLYDGIFRQSGILKARSITELFDFCWVLGSQSPPQGRRVAVQTNSGGPGAAAADACEQAGLELPVLSPATTEKLAEYIPQTGSIKNPVDVTYSRNPDDFLQGILLALLDDDRTDSLLIYFYTPRSVIQRYLEGSGMPRAQAAAESDQLLQIQAEKASDLINRHPKPVIGFTWRSLEEPFNQTLLKGGVPLFPDPECGARALAALARYRELRDKLLAGIEKAA